MTWSSMSGGDDSPPESNQSPAHRNRSRATRSRHDSVSGLGRVVGTVTASACLLGTRVMVGSMPRISASTRRQRIVRDLRARDVLLLKGDAHRALTGADVNTFPAPDSVELISRLRGVGWIGIVCTVRGGLQ